MLEIIVFIIIIYLIYKKNNNVIMTPESFKITLKNKGFGNITIITQTTYGSWITADYHGDNYIFYVIKPGHSISPTIIDTFYQYASKKHYHNIILVPGNATILTTAKTTISTYGIQVWNKDILNSKFGTAENYTSSAIVEKAPINDNCEIDAPFDPIQDGSKVNSIFGNLFGNKIDRL